MAWGPVLNEQPAAPVMTTDVEGRRQEASTYDDDDNDAGGRGAAAKKPRGQVAK